VEGDLNLLKCIDIEELEPYQVPDFR